MKASYLKIAVLTLALAATAQTVRTAYAQSLTESAYQAFTPETRVSKLLERKIYLEGQGTHLSTEETKVLMNSMKEAYQQMKTELPKIVEKTESPTI